MVPSRAVTRIASELKHKAWVNGFRTLVSITFDDENLA